MEDRRRSGGEREIFINARYLTQTLTGVQRYAAEMVAALDRRFASPAPDDDPRPPILLAPRSVIVKADKIGLANIPLRRVGRLGGGVPWTQLDLPYHARNRVLWSPANAGPVYHRRHVVTIHDAAVLDHPEWFSPRFAAYYRFLLPKLAKKAARVLTVSESSRQRLAETLDLDPTRIPVVPNGVDPKFKPAPPEAVAEASKRLGLPKYYVLALGSLEPRKNLARLLQAWSLLLARRDVPEEAVLVVVGGKSALFRDAGLSTTPERVMLPGYVADEDLPTLYSGARALVYPSLYEGFGLPPLEAMACGTPVVTSNVSSLPEVVGDAALLVDPHGAESIAEGLRRMLDDAELRHRLRTAGIRRAELFDWDDSARRLWGYLREVDRP